MTAKSKAAAGDKSKFGLYKTVFFGTLAVVFLLFWDALLPMLGGGLHLTIEVVEITLEHFLEHAFGLTARQAQFVLAYTALALVLYALWRLFRKVQAAIERFRLAASALEARVAERTQVVRARLDRRTLLVAALCLATGATLFLFI